MARPEGPLTVVFLDVGQGDATFVRFPSGASWLIDAGGMPGRSAFDIGARVVAPALWAMGVRRLGVIALTHGDPDHVGGARSIATDFRPTEVWEGIDVPGHAPMMQVRSAAAAVGSRWVQRRRGERIAVGEVTVDVVHPAAPDWERRRVRNDDSLTLDLRYRHVRIILPGDIGQTVERELLALNEQAGTRPMTVLKVPHHGSAGSSSAEWLLSVAPSLAVVSAGRGNRFGHPAPAAVARYEALGIPLVRTDRLGAIAVVTDGVGLQAWSWNGTAWKPLISNPASLLAGDPSRASAGIAGGRRR
jgi:competence protein ComEC